MRVLLPLLLAARLLLWLSPAHAAEKAIQDGWAVDDQDRVLLTPRVAREMRECGAKWVRLHFRLNGRHRAWDAALMDAYAKAARNLRVEKLQILGLVTYESWPGSQADWVANNHEVDGGNGDNGYLREWAEKAFRPLLARFPEVRYWEIWNEPNNWTKGAPSKANRTPGGFYIYPSNFAWLLRRAYEAARAQPGRERIVSGGLLGADFTGRPDSDVAAPYLRDTFRAGRELAGWQEIRRRYGSWPADHWGLHLYVGQSGKLTPEYFAPYPAAFVKALEELLGRESHAQVWLTEWGYPTAPKGMSPDQQAACIRTVLSVLASMPRFGPVFYFKLHDEPAADLYYGLRLRDDTPKPAWDAFRTAKMR